MLYQLLGLILLSFSGYGLIQIWLGKGGTKWSGGSVGGK